MYIPHFTLIPLLVTVLLAAPTYAQRTSTSAEDTTAADPGWIAVSSTDDFTVLANPARFRVLPNGNVRLWMRWQYTNGRILEEVSGRPVAAYRMTETEIDCAQEMIRNLRSIYYDRAGRVIESYSQPSQWQGVVPESVAGGTYGKCADM